MTPIKPSVFTRGSYHYAGQWIIFVPMVGEYIELVERVADPIIGRIWAKMRNRRMYQ